MPSCGQNHATFHKELPIMTQWWWFDINNVHLLMNFNIYQFKWHDTEQCCSAMLNVWISKSEILYRYIDLRSIICCKCDMAQIKIFSSIFLRSKSHFIIEHRLNCIHLNSKSLNVYTFHLNRRHSELCSIVEFGETSIFHHELEKRNKKTELNRIAYMCIGYGKTYRWELVTILIETQRTLID